MHALRALASRGWLARFPGPLAQALRVGSAAAWPWQALYRGVQLNQRFGAEVAELTGKGRTRQVLEQLCWSLLENVPPVAYYRYGLFEVGAPGADYLHPHDVTGLARALGAPGPGNPVDDKAAFARLCAAEGLPTAEVLARVDAAGAGELSLPARDLFVKPVRAARGEGALRLAWSEGGHRLPDGQRLRPGALQERARRHGELLVQELLRDARELDGVSPGALSTVRLVTGRWPDGRVEPLAASFQVALRPDQLVSTHGLSCAIELSSGRLGPGYRYRPLSSAYPLHPLTEGRLEGRALPSWKETVECALRAHRALPGEVFLGWDVALTDAGPKLLEANRGWDPALVQRPQGVPLGQTRLAAIALAAWGARGVQPQSPSVS